MFEMTNTDSPTHIQIAFNLMKQFKILLNLTEFQYWPIKKMMYK